MTNEEKRARKESWDMFGDCPPVRMADCKEKFILSVPVDNDKDMDIDEIFETISTIMESLKRIERALFRKEIKEWFDTETHD